MFLAATDSLGDASEISCLHLLATHEPTGNLPQVCTRTQMAAAGGQMLELGPLWTAAEAAFQKVAALSESSDELQRVPAKHLPPCQMLTNYAAFCVLPE